MHRRSLMIAIAIFFAVLSLRGSSDGDVTYNDEARHAMNGVALHDLVRDGAIDQPVRYLKQYFARYPALSMPYHPPLFPAIEAMFFTLFGVSHFSARLAIACCVFGVALLLFELVFFTHKSAYLATATVVAFFSVPLSQRLAADVMLEMPTLFFVLASVLCMRRWEPMWTDRAAIGAGLFAAAAIWTKQAIFVGLIPLVMIGAWHRWSLLRKRPIWIFLALYTVGILSLATLWVNAGLTGFAKNWEEIGLAKRIVRNVFYYVPALHNPLVIIAACLVAACLVYERKKPRWRLVLRDLNPLYVGWIAAVAAVLVVVPAIDGRYLWFALPPFLALAAGALNATACSFLPAAVSKYVVVAVAGAMFLWNVRTPLPFLSGPAQAANYVQSKQPRRVLISARSNGSFIFALRASNPRQPITVIRADKLEPNKFRPDQMESFAHRFGIEMMIVEDTGSGSPGQQLLDSPAPSMLLEKVVTQQSTNSGWRGRLLIFRFTRPSSSPESVLKIPVYATSQELELRL
ncbi:MAG: glycosyltransferase family 39 protein [Bryobacteraceae bacterium]